MKVNIIMLFLVVASFFSCENRNENFDLKSLENTVWDGSFISKKGTVKATIVFEFKTIGYYTLEKDSNKDIKNFKYELEEKKLFIDGSTEYIFSGTWLIIDKSNSKIKLIKNVGTLEEWRLEIFRRNL